MTILRFFVLFFEVKRNDHTQKKMFLIKCGFFDFRDFSKLWDFWEKNPPKNPQIPKILKNPIFIIS